MNKKIFLTFGLFFITFSQALAFEAKLSSNKENVELGNNVKLRVEIQTQDAGFLEMRELKGLENFEVLSRSQSQSFSSRTAVVNGETKSITSSVSYIDYVLSPQIVGEFNIGPAVISDENEIKNSNTIKVVVNKNNTTNNETGSFSSYKNIEAKQVQEKINYNKLSFILILVILFLIGVLFYNMNPQIFDNAKEKIIKNKTDIKDLDFESIEEIVYPEITDNDFVLKIEKILKIKINKKYHINSFENKTYTEIISEIDNNLVDKEVILKIVDNLNKIKYSNILVNKSEILDLVKKI